MDIGRRCKLAVNILLIMTVEQDFTDEVKVGVPGTEKHVVRSEEDHSELVVEITTVKVPDGGWGWVVVIASLVFNIIYDGCSYSFGILFTNLLDYFGDTKSNTAWIGSLFFSVPLLCGPVAVVVSKKLGYRASTMLGGVVVSAGFAVGSFSNSTWILVLSYGLVSGFGVSIPYFNSTVVVANYFDKRRALATGIAECGAGAGTVVFAPLTLFLVSSFGWRGALLILSGITANIIVCGALYRPIETTEKTLKESYILEEQSDKYARNEEYDDLDFDDRETNKKKHNPQATALLANGSESERSPLKMTSKEQSFDGNRQTSNCSAHTHSPDTVCHDSTEPVNTNCFKREHTFYKEILSVKFIVFLILNFVMYFWYDVPYVFLVDKTVHDGISETQATYLISLIGIVHTVGILLYGCVGDRKWINCSLLFGVSIFLCGASMFSVPMFREYSILAVLSGGFGLFSASAEALVPIILIEIVGLRNFDKAFGIVMFFEGVANLLGPPLAGKFNKLHRLCRCFFLF